MKRFFPVVAVLATLLAHNPRASAIVYGQGAPANQAAATSALAAKSAQVDALFAPFNQGGTPGVAVMVIQEGQIVHSKGYGLARLDSKEPVDANTAFDLASMSKQFTAMAVMILAERGKLSYEDSVSKFFPEFPAYARKITIRHLLNHTSGLVDAINPKWFKAGYEPTSRDLGKLMAQERTVNFEPGEKFEYNNAGYVLLALIVEKVSGQRFARFMQENVFKPLSMNNTLIWDESKPKVEHLAISYAPADNGFKSIDYLSDVYLYGPKGVVTTAADLYKWNEALETEKLVKATTLRQAFTPSKLNNGTESPYGFGWAMGKEGGLDVVEHGGGYLGYRTNIKRYPGQRTTVILLANNAQVEVAPLGRKIGQIYLSDKMVAPVAIKVDSSILNSYVGKYEGDPAVMPNLIIEITLEDGELYITSPIKPKTKLLAQSPTEFSISETASTVSFNRDDKGTVSGLVLKTRRAIINARRLGP